MFTKTSLPKLATYYIFLIQLFRKHKKRHKKDNGHHSGLPTIPSSPTDEGKVKKGVAFYIDEEESDKDEKDGLMTRPEIVIDPPSDASFN